MDEIEERRRIMLRNLAMHAGSARRRLCLPSTEAARLAGITPEILADVENGRGCLLTLAVLTHLAQTLGLTELGEPRPLPPGME